VIDFKTLQCQNVLAAAVNSLKGIVYRTGTRCKILKIRYPET